MNKTVTKVLFKTAGLLETQKSVSKSNNSIADVLYTHTLYIIAL